MNMTIMLINYTTISETNTNLLSAMATKTNIKTHTTTTTMATTVHVRTTNAMLHTNTTANVE